MDKAITSFKPIIALKAIAHMEKKRLCLCVLKTSLVLL